MARPCPPPCVVTGAAGFIGSHLCERLLALGHAVIGVDMLSSGSRANLGRALWHPRFSLVEADIREAGLLGRLLGPSSRGAVCFNLAAIVSVPYSMEHPEATLEINHTACVRLLAEAVDRGLASFVFAGSAAEYGLCPRIPLREEDAAGAGLASPYGQAKYLSTACVSRSPIGVSLRLFNVYGPRQDPANPYSGVITKFFALACSGRPLAIFGDGGQTRDFVHVDDVVGAFVAAAGLPDGQPLRGVFNIGTGKGLTILELAEHVSARMPRPVARVFLPERPGDIRHSVAAVDKFRASVGWHPATTIQEGLQRMSRQDDPDPGRPISNSSKI